MKDKSLQEILSIIFVPVALIVFSFMVMFPYMPSHYFINRDSGIFLYIGREITLGRSLYVDMWDHKGPLLFFINALGYWAGKRNGVWFIQCVSLAISAIAGYLVLKKVLNSKLALFGTAAWIYSFYFLLGGGNLSEEFALPMSFLSIFFFYRYLNNEKRVYLVLIGAAMGLSAMLRPNNIGVQLVICAIIVIPDIWRAKIARSIQNIVPIFAGLALVLVPIFSYFLIKGSFSEFINATFLFNFLYANGQGFSDPLAMPLFIIISGWPGWFAACGWFFVLKDIFSKDCALPVPIALLLLIGFPVEIFLDTLSARPYLHYVLMLLPYIGFLSAFFLYRLIPILKRQNNFRKFSLSILIIFIMFFSLWSNLEYLGRGSGGAPALDEYSELVTFIQSNTSKTDTVLVWGQELSINVLSERESPTPFAHQTFFLYDGMVIPHMEQIFLAGLEKNRPAIVIITDALPFSDSNLESFEAQIKFMRSDEINVFRSFSEYVNKNYHKVKTIQGYKVFVLNK